MYWKLFFHLIQQNQITKKASRGINLEFTVHFSDKCFDFAKNQYSIKIFATKAS